MRQSKWTAVALAAALAIGASRARAEDTLKIAVGQLTPPEVRQMALDWLSAAEVAEHDAAVYAEMTDGLDVTPDHALAFISALRARRDGQS